MIQKLRNQTEPAFSQPATTGSSRIIHIDDRRITIPINRGTLLPAAAHADNGVFSFFVDKDEQREGAKRYRSTEAVFRWTPDGDIRLSGRRSVIAAAANMPTDGLESAREVLFWC